MLLDYFGVFGWISRNRDKISKFGQFRGPTPRRRDPTQQRKSTPRCGMSTPRRVQEGGLDKPKVCRDVAKLRCVIATAHSMEILCFCFVLLFR